MTLFAPAFLLLALLAGVVLLLHARRRRTNVVPSLMLWRKITDTGASRSQAWKVPPASASLLLQLAAVLLAALALSQPLLGRGNVPDHVVFIADISSPMGALNNEGTTLVESAQRAIQERADEAAAAGVPQMSLITAAVVSGPLVARLAPEHANLAGHLATLAAQDGNADWAATGRYLRAMVRTEENTHIIAATTPDGLAQLRAELPEEQTVELLPGAPAAGPDTAISASLSRVPDTNDMWDISGTVTFSGGARSADVVIRFMAENASEPLDWARLTVTAPGAADTMARSATRPFRHTIQLPADGILTVSTGSDATPANNTARFIARAHPVTGTALYVSADAQTDPSLLRALLAVDGLQLERAVDLPEDTSGYALVIIDNEAVSHAPQTNTIWIGTARLTGTAPPPALASPDPVSWRNDHVLARGIDWASIKIATARALTPWSDGTLLLGAADGALVETRSGAIGRELRLAFSPEQSTWAAQASFPTFISRFLSWAGITPSNGGACTVGQYCAIDTRLAAHGQLERLDGPLPAGMATTLENEAAYSREGSFVPRHAGLYRLSQGDRAQTIAVNPAPMAAAAAGQEIENLPPAQPLPRPLWHWLLALAFLALLAEAAVAARQRQLTRGMMAVRGATLALVLLALAAPVVSLPFYRTDTVILSTGSGAATTTHFAGNSFFATQRTAIIEAGYPLRVVRDWTGEISEVSASPYAANMGEPLKLATAMLPAHAPGSILLEDDRRTATGDVAPALAALTARGISVDTAETASAETPSPSVMTVAANGPLFSGDNALLTTIIHATEDSAGEINILRDETLIARQTAALGRGLNRMEAVISNLTEPTTVLEVSAGTDGAAGMRNGVAVTVRPMRDVAILASDPVQGEALAAQLATDGIAGRVIPLNRAPAYLNDWLRYGVVVMLNVPAIALTTGQQALLETAVRDHGLGLIMAGGDRSFGPGGYLETALDRLAPVSSNIPGEAPEVALAFVLDRSGSMQQAVGDVSRLDIAKQATLSAISRLNENSSVAVVVFDDRAQTVLPLQPADDIAGIERALARFGPGGGTAIHPALVVALEELRHAEAAARHVIVMTDGLTQPADFAGIVGQMRAAGITISTVAIGSGAALPIVERIATLGGGAFHATTDFEALPSILSQEAMLLSTAPVEEIRTQPAWADKRSAFVSPLPDPMPTIDGFVLTSPKPEATINLVTPDSDGEVMPLLAHWRYGAGNVVALTTDLNGGWSRQWQTLESYPAFLTGMVRQFFPTAQPPGLTASMTRYGDEVVLSVTALDDLGETETGLSPVARISGPMELGFPLREVSAGRYEGSFVATETGTYRAQVFANEAISHAAIHIAYPARSGPFAADNGAALLADATGGRVLSTEEVTLRAPEWQLIPTTAWKGIVLLALALLMAELYWRYASPSLLRRRRSSSSPAAALRPR